MSSPFMMFTPPFRTARRGPARAGRFARSRRLSPTLTLLAALALAPAASAQYTLLASHDLMGDGGDANSNSPRLSADGRVVAFVSVADDLVPGDTNGVTDVFAWDRVTGIVQRVSVSSAGVEGNSFSSTPTLSADGRFVAFSSSASNLVSGDTNGVADIFRHDRVTGITVRVSTSSGALQGNGSSSAPSISSAGRFVAFTSAASNLVLSDTNGLADVFVKDMISGVCTIESVAVGGVQANAQSQRPSLSADGRHVAFHSAASNLTPGDTNGVEDVFTRDRLSNLLLRVSVGPGGTVANSDSRNPSISADGTRVAFESTASNLDPSDVNGQRDVYFYNATTNLCARIEQTEGGKDPSLSGDGLRVAFTTAVPIHILDNNGVDDVYLKVIGGGLARLNLSSDGVQGNGASTLVSLDAEGRRAAFVSQASNLVNASVSGQQVYLRDTVPAWTDIGYGMIGALGFSHLTGDGTLLPNSANALTLSNAAPSVPAFLVLGLTELLAPFKFGTLVPFPDVIISLTTNGSGTLTLPFTWPVGNWSGLDIYTQYWLQDGSGLVGWSASNALVVSVP